MSDVPVSSSSLKITNLLFLLKNMCSVGDDFENEGEKYLQSDRKINLNDLKCNKCKVQTPIILLRRKDAYCKNCFLNGTNHKFKALVGKSKLIRPNDKVLISYEPGHPSTALLHFLRCGLDLDTPKKLRFLPVVIFLEDQYHLTVTEREAMIKKAVSEAELHKFDMHLVPLAECINSKEVSVFQNDLTLEENDGEKVNKLFRKGLNESNRKEILHVLKRNTLLQVAKKLDCKYIFTPHLSMDIASNLLTSISLGRGFQVPMDTGFCDDRYEIKILTPLRTFDMKELALYNALHGIEPVSVRQPTVNQYSSIQSLMKHFISDLQENYPASITTVVKTGDKLSMDKDKVSGKCKLCQGVIVKRTAELNSEDATHFSKLVSNTLPDHSVTRQERYLEMEKRFDLGQTQNDYCFSCFKLSEYFIGDIE